MNDITTEEKLNKVYEFCIRMEPTVKEVEYNRKWREGNGLPGAKFQLWVLWAVSVAIALKIWAAV